MKYCSKCGAEIQDDAIFCPKCGCSVAPMSHAIDNSVSDKEWLLTLLLCFFLGVFGVHRFYVGRTGSGIAMVLTIGGLGIWVLVDFFVILCKNFKDKDGKLVQK